MALACAVEVGHDLAGGAAGVEVAEPGGDVGGGVVGLGLLLDVDDDHGDVEVTHGGQDVVARGVGEHLQDHEVDVRGAEEVARLLGRLLGGDHASVDELDGRGQGRLEVGVLLLEVGNELRELRQVGAERDGEDADLCLGVDEHGFLLVVLG